MSTVIVVPVLGRPHRVAPLIESITEATPEPHRVLFVATATDGDTLDAVKASGADLIAMDEPGTYARKINAGYEASDEPLMFMAADDLRFHDGWLSRALRWMAPGVEVVGTNDLCNPRVMHGEHSTHTLLTRTYIEERGGTLDGTGSVLCELYPHEYCDDEFVQIAKARGVYAHAFDSLVEHLHVLNGKAPDDATYRLGRAHTRESRRMFQQRRRQWRNLPVGA